MANMAIDSWLPHRFAQLSDRLTMQNGVLLMGGASLAALLYTRGDITTLVTMYSINVFVTFSLSQLAMLPLLVATSGRSGWTRGARHPRRGLRALRRASSPVNVYEKVRAGRLGHASS